MKHSAAAAIGVLMVFATGTASADTITDWNQTAIAVLKAANVGGNPWSRSMAMVHVAMSDAVNSVQGRYTRYVATGPLARDASAEAAASSAARQVLLQLYPDQKAMIDEAYAASTKGIPDGAAKSAGVALGEQVAALVHADRAAAPASPTPTGRSRRQASGSPRRHRCSRNMRGPSPGCSGAPTRSGRARRRN
jgi:hypothetical protein